MKAWAGAALGVALGIMAWAGPATAAGLPYPGDVLQSLLEAQDRRAWTRADLVKTETSSASPGNPTVTKGSFVASGRRAVLHITAPAPGRVVADGKFLWVELPQVNQVYRYPQAQLAVSGNFFLDLASSIRHYSRVSVKRHFRPRPPYDPARVGAFELKPRRDEPQGFGRMQVWVDTRRWVVLRVRMEYAGTQTDIVFSRIRVASWRELKRHPQLALPEGVFRYRKPKGFEIFDMNL